MVAHEGEEVVETRFVVADAARGAEVEPIAEDAEADLPRYRTLGGARDEAAASGMREEHVTVRRKRPLPVTLMHELVDFQGVLRRGE